MCMVMRPVVVVCMVMRSVVVVCMVTCSRIERSLELKPLLTILCSSQREGRGREGVVSG